VQFGCLKQLYQFFKERFFKLRCSFGTWRLRGGNSKWGLARHIPIWVPQATGTRRGALQLRTLKPQGPYFKDRLANGHCSLGVSNHWAVHERHTRQGALQFGYLKPQRYCTKLRLSKTISAWVSKQQRLAKAYCSLGGCSHTVTEAILKIVALQAALQYGYLKSQRWYF
jgi:hypothetical protein